MDLEGSLQPKKRGAQNNMIKERVVNMGNVQRKVSVAQYDGNPYPFALHLRKHQQAA